MLVSETRFTDRSYVRIFGYTVHHTNHPSGNAQGGTAVIIKNSIKHAEMEKYDKDYLQATTILINELNFPLLLSAIYCPPRHAITEDDFSRYFNTLGIRFISGGDWNAKHQHWGSRLTSPRGRQLFRSITTNGLQCMSSGEPTHWPYDLNKIPDLLDFFISKGISHNYNYIESCCDLSSDHSPVILTISLHVIFKEVQAQLLTARTDLEYFRLLVKRRINLNVILKHEDEIDDAVDNLTKAIQLSAWEATPSLPLVQRYQNHYPLYIREKIVERRQLRRIWQTRRYPEDKNRFNRSSQELKRLILDFKNENFRQYLESLSASSESDYSLWKATKKFKRPVNIIAPLRKPNGLWARDSAEKAGSFAEHLSKVFEPFPSTLDPAEEHDIIDFLNAPFQMSLPIEPFTVADIENVIKNEINPNKVAGFDLIKGKTLKELPKEGFKLITLIFNAILRTGYFPSLWKIGQIIMILKPGKDPTEVASYRPISLLPVLSKVFEKLFLRKLKPVLCDLIPDYQYGFREKHSTIEQVHRVIDLIHLAYEKHQYCSAVFLDISQAFDKVWHNGLLYKIKEKLPHTFYTIFKSYLSNRCFQIRYEDALTDLHIIRSGVPQGSVLGPVLYLLFTSDLPTTTNTTIATFADDTALLAIHDDSNIASHYVQNHLNLLELWLQKWRMKVNERKSTHVTFTLRRGDCASVSLNNQVIPQENDTKYLGVHLDRRLTWRKHIQFKRKQLDLKFKKMYWLLGRNSQLSKLNKLMVYKTTLKPVWTYGIQLWGTAMNSNIEILERFQSKTLRNILNIPWYISNRYIYQDLKLNTVKQEIVQFSERYQQRLENHPNYLAVNLLDNSLNNFQRLRRYNILDNIHRFND
jgi:hypothetical protein